MGLLLLLQCAADILRRHATSMSRCRICLKNCQGTLLKALCPWISVRRPAFRVGAGHAYIESVLLHRVLHPLIACKSMTPRLNGKRLSNPARAGRTLDWLKATTALRAFKARCALLQRQCCRPVFTVRQVKEARAH